MTIVFGGIDLPIFELLFIVSVLLLCGLFVMIMGIFYILKEIRELKKDLNKEEDNIKEFEKGIAKLDEFNKEDKTTEKLKQYIKDNLEKYTWDTIKEHLKSQGWDEKQVEDTYRKLK